MLYWNSWRGDNMTTREKILELLEAERGVYFSGEDIAGRLSVSRAAVWKAVKALQKDGYAIDAVTNKGYCLSAETDILSVQGIRKYLNHESTESDMTVLPTASSTNALLREKADSGAPEGCMILANEQTGGRGRLSRSFFSPRDTGIYMSLLLRPKNYSAKEAVRITTMAAVAMCEAIESVSDEKAAIKWVNDIYVRGKKVCGILTEGSFSLESGLLEYAVLGIGINLYPPEDGFPRELADIAGAVFQTKQDDAKNRIVSEFLNRFYSYYQEADQERYVGQYQKRSFVVGKQVTILSAGKQRDALVLGIDDQCRLLVRYDDGTEDCCSSGEISVRLTQDGSL